MALGLCCQWLTAHKGKPKNILVSRSLQLTAYRKGKYSHQKIKQTYLDNLNNLLELLPTIIGSGIRSFRVSSAMFPLFDKVPRELAENDETLGLLEKIGAIAIANGVRLTTHPGQYAVISSDEEHKVANALREVDYHGWMFDKMNLPKTPYYSINIHGGKSNRRENLIAGISRLSPSARCRLTLENCEFAYSVKDLEPIARETGVPICFDSHHHRFNTAGLSGEEAMAIAMDTWPKGIRPMTHISNSKPEYSESDPATKLRQHSDYLSYFPDYQLEANNSGKIDVEVEAKKKNFAIFKAVEDFGLSLA